MKTCFTPKHHLILPKSPGCFIIVHFLYHLDPKTIVRVYVCQFTHKSAFTHEHSENDKTLMNPTEILNL